jgi:hypothetical protein
MRALDPTSLQVANGPRAQAGPLGQRILRQQSRLPIPSQQHPKWRRRYRTNDARPYRYRQLRRFSTGHTHASLLTPDLRDQPRWLGNDWSAVSVSALLQGAY